MNVKNPKLFRELSEPFESSDKANEALNAFFEELSELRKKHKLRDIHTIVCGTSLDSDGDESEWFAIFHHGDPTKAEAMSAYAFGLASKDREELIGKLAAATGKRKPL